MRKLLVFAMMLAMVGTAMAFDLGNERPDKPVVNYPQNVPSADRQGGDTILDAVQVTLPVVNGAGTTAGYNDDYVLECAADTNGSWSPVEATLREEDGSLVAFIAAEGTQKYFRLRKP